MRMALGADFGHVAALTYRSVLIPSAFGLAIRLGAAAGLTRLLKTLLFRVSAGDPITLTFAGLTLVMISVLAATSPAIRATLSDPARILRRE
jgi:putative ABC transport system permease protein